MGKLKRLFDYQRFEKNPGLEAKIDDVRERYLSKGRELSDDMLDVSAAGGSYDFLSDKSERKNK